MNILTSLFAYLLILIPSPQLVFDLKCPHRSHVVYRAKEICKRNDFYHCLYDMNTGIMREECFKPEDLPPGYHSVISGRLHVKQCDDNHLSPHLAWSNDSYECQYQKSICSEEGQIVANNGSSTKDTKCRCDYRKGYAFIFKPKNECICSPSVEDCSCHLVHCHNSNAILSQDYVCLKQDKKSTVMKCPPIEIERKSDSNEDIKTETIVHSFSDLRSRKIHLICSIMVALVCFIGVYFIYTVRYIPMESKSEEERILQNVSKLSMFPVLKHTINKTSLLIFTGRRGSGKTTLSKYLHERYPKKHCIIVRLRKAKLNYHLPQESYIIIDSHGKMSAFEHSIRIYLNNIKATKLIIVVEDIPPNLIPVLQEFAINLSEVLFDVDDEDFYNSRDKEIILKLHMKMNNVYSEDEMTKLQSLGASEAVCVENSLFADLLNEETLLGFPSMCASFCSHKDHIRQGIQYFRQPPALLITEIDDLREKGESDDISAIQYCLFVSVLLCLKNNMSLTHGDLQASITMNMKHIFPNRRVPLDLRLIQTIVSHVMPHFLESSSSELKFSNHTIYQAVLIKYCNTHPQPIFDKCNMCDIIMFLRPPNYQPLKDEMVLTVDYRHSDFVTLVINSLMCGNQNADNIIKEIKRFIEYYKDTQLLQLIINHIKSDQTYTHQFRLRCFREFGEFSRKFNSSNAELEAYYLAWKYVNIKRQGNDDELKTCTESMFECEVDVIGKVLHTFVDKFGNTLLHYFVLWNGIVETTIIDTLVLYAKQNKDEHGIADVLKSTNLENVRKHTPLHFAVFLGRNDLFDNFKTMKEIAQSKETSLHSLYGNVRKMFLYEKENLIRLLESGMNHILEDIKCDKEMSILFETEIIPSQSAFRFGEKEEFDDIMSILHDSLLENLHLFDEISDDSYL